MTKNIQLHTILTFFLLLTPSCSSSKNLTESAENRQNADKIIVAYVTSWTDVIPETKHITHINYAFGHVDSTFHGVRIDNEERLKKIVKLRDTKKELKILLSLGGWRSGGFSEMAADEKCRHLFVADCRRVVDEFGLDGIDVDWEFPASGSAGISSSSEDKDNFTKLIRDLREVLGEEKLVTIASSARKIYFDFPAIIHQLDFVNLMTYDMGSPPFHHSALFPSAFTRVSGEESVKMHLKAGVPMEKIVFGIPFYGRGKSDAMKFLTFKEVKNQNFTEKWDTFAKVPYLINSKGEIVLVYENPLSIVYKCNFILEKGLRGAMFWEYAGDDEQGSLRKTIWNELMNREK